MDAKNLSGMIEVWKNMASVILDTATAFDLPSAPELSGWPAPRDYVLARLTGREAITLIRATWQAYLGAKAADAHELDDIRQIENLPDPVLDERLNLLVESMRGRDSKGVLR